MRHVTSQVAEEQTDEWLHSELSEYTDRLCGTMTIPSMNIYREFANAWKRNDEVRIRSLMIESRKLFHRLWALEMKIRPLVRLRFEMNRGLAIPAKAAEIKRISTDDELRAQAQEMIRKTLKNHCLNVIPSKKMMAQCQELEELEIMFSRLYSMCLNSKLWRVMDIPLHQDELMKGVELFKTSKQ